MTHPRVSVVTPFRNSAPYLAQCIQSVLAQSYPDFEYILSDNGSTDSSLEIAEKFASGDPRIRVVKQPRLFSQVEHYNAALTEISRDSDYCKIVQADDSIFPDCLQLMLQVFQQSESIGLVSSYYLKGEVVRGTDYPFPEGVVSGKEVARFYLRTGIFFLGSPTTVMYRSSIVRESGKFYEESLLHEDTERCMQILENWDFGFVRRVLSFLRTDNESISSTVRTLSPNSLDGYIVVKRYAPVFLEPNEATSLVRRSRTDYYRTLARASLKNRERAFWIYHEKGLQTAGEKIDTLFLATQIGRELCSSIANPGATLSSVMRRLILKSESVSTSSEANVSWGVETDSTVDNPGPSKRQE